MKFKFKVIIETILDPVKVGYYSSVSNLNDIADCE